MSELSTWRYGAPIPEESEEVSRAICLPETWVPVVRGALFAMTYPHFWQSDATDEDREAATGIAHNIVARFASDDCQCEEEPCPPGGYLVWNFENSDGGFVNALYGEYVAASGWRTTVSDELDGRHARLVISNVLLDGYYTLLEFTNAVMTLSGPGSKVAVKIDIGAYNPSVGTLLKHRSDFEAYAIGTNTQFYVKPVLNVRNLCWNRTMSINVSVDIGPYNPTFVSASFLLASMQGWARL